MYVLSLFKLKKKKSLIALSWELLFLRDISLENLKIVTKIPIGH